MDHFAADRESAAILRSPVLRDTIGLDRPVALLLVAVLHFLHDDEQTAGVVAQLLDPLPPGSYLVLTHGTMDFSSPAGVAAYEEMFAAGARTSAPVPRPRSRAISRAWRSWSRASSRSATGARKTRSPIVRSARTSASTASSGESPRPPPVSSGVGGGRA